MPELLHVARVLETNTFIFPNVASDQHCGEWDTMTSVQEGGRRQWCSQCDQQEHFNRIRTPRCARARPEFILFPYGALRTSRYANTAAAQRTRPPVWPI